eukprot:scaffold100171_cov34-Prasinocladus_malaysianus.AAC.2
MSRSYLGQMRSINGADYDSSLTETLASSVFHGARGAQGGVQEASNRWSSGHGRDRPAGALLQPALPSGGAAASERPLQRGAGDCCQGPAGEGHYARPEPAGAGGGRP